jgi:hypothetical protein
MPVSVDGNLLLYRIGVLDPPKRRFWYKRSPMNDIIALEEKDAAMIEKARGNIVFTRYGVSDGVAGFKYLTEKKKEQEAVVTTIKGMKLDSPEQLAAKDLLKEDTIAAWREAERLEIEAAEGNILAPRNHDYADIKGNAISSAELEGEKIKL